MIHCWGEGILNLVVNSGISILHQLGPVNLINIESQKFLDQVLSKLKFISAESKKNGLKYCFPTHYVPGPRVYPVLTATPLSPDRTVAGS